MRASLRGLQKLEEEAQMRGSRKEFVRRVATPWGQDKHNESRRAKL